MLNFVTYLDPELFKSFYSIQKQQLLNRSCNSLNNYKVNIKNDLNKDQTGFRKIKNNVPTRVFFGNENNIDDSIINQSQIINEDNNSQ